MRKRKRTRTRTRTRTGEDTGALEMIAKLLVARFTVLKKGGYGRTDGPTDGSTDQQTAGPTNGPLIEMRGRI